MTFFAAPPCGEKKTTVTEPSVALSKHKNLQYCDFAKKEILMKLV